MNQRETLRKRVYSYFEKNRDHGKKFSADHFISEGIPRSTVYDILHRCASGESVLDRKSTGRPPKIFIKKFKSSLKRLTNNKSGVSQRKLANRFKCSKTLIFKALKSMSISCWKKTDYPRPN